MFTYRATYRLSAAADSDNGQRVWNGSTTLLIQDMTLHHAAARAEWQRPVVATREGWAPGRTELVSVMLAGVDMESGAGRAMATALQLVGCRHEARRLVTAAAVVNAGQ